MSVAEVGLTLSGFQSLFWPTPVTPRKPSGVAWRCVCPGGVPAWRYNHKFTPAAAGGINVSSTAGFTSTSLAHSRENKSVHTHGVLGRDRLLPGERTVEVGPAGCSGDGRGSQEEEGGAGTHSMIWRSECIHSRPDVENAVLTYAWMVAQPACLGTQSLAVQNLRG